jgi:hypothetical protein
MGEARRRKLAGTEHREVEIVGVGFGGLCGECDHIHPRDPNPFLYTVGLTEWRLPELLLVASGAGVGIAGDLGDVVGRLAQLQRRRRTAFKDGEHVHAEQIGLKYPCVQLAEVDPPDEFELGAASQRYGRDGYRVLVVVPYDHTGALFDNPANLH